MRHASSFLDKTIWELFKKLSTWDGTVSADDLNVLKERILPNSDNRVVTYNRHMADLKKDLPEWTARFVPKDVAFGLGFADEVKLARNIRKMLELAEDPDVNDPDVDPEVHERIQCEAYKLSLMSVFKADLEDALSQDAFNDALQNLMSAIRPKIFDKTSRKVVISMRHDERHRVTDVGVDCPLPGNPNLIHVQKVLTRFFDGGKPCIRNVAEKDPTSTMLKIFSKLVNPKIVNGFPEDPLEIIDRVRAQFILENTDDGERMLERFEEVLRSERVTFSEREGRLDGHMDGTNKDSSPLYHGVKIVVYWDKFPIEFQFMTMPNFYTSEYSPDASHWSFKARRSRPILKGMYPLKIYGRDFMSDSFKEWQMRVINGHQDVDMREREHQK